MAELDALELKGLSRQVPAVRPSKRYVSGKMALRETGAPGTVRSGGMNTPRENEGVGEHVRTRFHTGPFGPVEIAGS